MSVAKPGLAALETLQLGCLLLDVSSWMFGFTPGCIKVKVVGFVTYKSSAKSVVVCFQKMTH